MESKTSVSVEPFSIASVRPSQPPSDTEGTNWHRYTIVQGNNTIHGYRRGSVNTVTTAVEEIVAQLNERRFGKRGHVPAAAASKKPAAK